MASEAGHPQLSFLLVTWDGGGNTPPMRAIAARLIARGHAVRVVGPESRRKSYESLGARFEPYRHAPEHDAGAPETDLIRDWEARTPLGAFARTRDNLMFGPAARFAEEVVAAVERERPSAAVIDYMLTGAAAGARRAGVPAVGLVHNIYPLPTEGVPPFGMGLAPARGSVGRFRDRVLGRIALRPFAVGLDALNRVRRDLQLPEIEELGALLDDFGAVVVAVPPEFDLAGRAPVGPRVRFAGHMAPPEPDYRWESPWPSTDRRPLVLVSLSTTFMDQRKLAARILSAVGDMPVRVLFTLGPALSVDGLRIPGNVVTADFVPHAAVLPEASAVVTHAGLGTVAAALSAGVPVVCMPSGRDQPDNAVRVVEASAGIRLSPRARPARIRAAVERALSDGRLQAGARRMQDAFERDGAVETVAILEEMATARAEPATAPDEDRKSRSTALALTGGPMGTGQEPAPPRPGSRSAPRCPTAGRPGCSSASTLLFTPACSAATRICAPAASWPQPCGMLDHAGHDRVGDLHRRLDRAGRASVTRGRAPSSSPSRSASSGCTCSGAALLAPHQRLEVVHPGVVRAQLAAADQHHARPFGAAERRAQPRHVGHDRLGRQLDPARRRAQHLGQARLQRAEVDAVRARLEARERQPVGVVAEASP